MTAVIVKYTGKRSGHEAITIPGVGYFEKGDEHELATKKEAETWAYTDDEGLSDWEIVGEAKADTSDEAKATSKEGED